MIPKRLREAREAAGLSQEALSELAISSRSGVANYEAGRFSPSFAWVSRVAKALNYPTGYFYTEDDEFASLILKLYQRNYVQELNVNSTIIQQLETVTLELQAAKKIINEINRLTSKAVI